MPDPARLTAQLLVAKEWVSAAEVEDLQAQLAAAENVVEAMRYIASAGEGIPDWRSMAQYAMDALAAYDAHKKDTP